MDNSYSITYDFNESVLGLGYVNEDGTVLVRDNGAWVEVSGTDDPRYYDYPFITVSENAVQLFDKLVQNGDMPNISSFSEVELD